MNRPIRLMGLFCMLLFFALMANATYVQYVDAGSLRDDPRNRRVIEAAFQRERGEILVGQRAVAESVPSSGRYDFQRRYPQNALYAPVTGYFSFYGQTGLERSQNDVLSGDDSRLFVRRLVDLVTNAEPQGGSVTTTIDARAQQAAYQTLRDNLGEDAQAAVVAIEPKTGKILAMVSNPSFNPNRYASDDLDAVSRYDRSLQDDPARPLDNRAIGTTLPPGSTFKLVTAAAAIESGKYDADSQVPGGNSFQLPQSTRSIGNEGRNCGTGDIPFRQALGNSCNTTFLALADELGAQRMREQAEKFGFNGTALQDLPGQAKSLYPAGMDAPQTAISGIGQASVTATPLQMAMVAAGIANDGVVMRPYVVDEVRSPDLDVLDRTDPEQLQRAVSKRTADELTDLMVYTVDDGTAGPGGIDGVQVAGKTGTAQSGTDAPPYAWFTSFAPADDPQVAVAVMIQSAPGLDRGEIAGGLLGGPIAKAVMEAVIDR